MKKVESILLNKHINLNKRYGKNMVTLLHLAVNNGNSVVCSMLLQSGAKVDVLNVNNMTPLHTAITYNSLERFNVLMSCGADIHRKDKENKSYLHVTASKEYMSLFKRLLEDHHHDICSTDDKGWNVLHSVPESGNWCLLQYFTEKGNDVYNTILASKHCMHIAVSTKQLEFSKRFLQNYGFDIKSKDTKRWTVLHFDASGNLDFATSGGHLKLCKTLLESYKIRIYKRDGSWCTFLHCACKNGDLRFFQYFMENGINISSKTKDHMNYLHFAASEGHLNLQETLVENYSLDIKIKSMKGWNVLHFSAKKGNLNLFRYFVQKGVDINENTRDSKSSLHIAGSMGHFILYKSLLEKYKLDINREDEKGSSLLHNAAQSGNIELIQYLVEKGRDIYSKRKKDMNFLHIAALNGSFHLCELLLEKANFDIQLHDYNGISVLCFAANTGDLEFFQYLTNKGTDVYNKTKDDINCLHIAALKRCCRLWKKLLEKHNVDIHIKDNSRRLLYFVDETGNSKLFQYLIEKANDVYNTTENSKNYLHIAASKSHFCLCKVLLEKQKFDIHMRDNDRCSVFQFAKNAGLKLFRHLIERGSDIYIQEKDDMNYLHTTALNGFLQKYNLDIVMNDDERSVLYFAAENRD